MNGSAGRPSFATALALLTGAVALGAAAFAQPAAFNPRDETPEEFAAGAGRDEAFYACTACPNFRLVAAQRLSRERWDDTIEWMTTRHKMPPLEGEDRKRVLDYLASAYPDTAGSRGGWRNPFQ
ncbi:MAG: hypothetical protein QOD74_2622 [Variibacter sp.]|nr:hypothetical protein [Variibacter sp.]